jgi:hypothetical protein
MQVEAMVVVLGSVLVLGMCVATCLKTLLVYQVSLGLKTLLVYQVSGALGSVLVLGMCVATCFVFKDAFGLPV